MATYASCAACGWRGVTHNFTEHVCCGENGYVPNHAYLQSGWPNDRTTWEKLGARSMDAINPSHRSRCSYTPDESASEVEKKELEE